MTHLRHCTDTRPMKENHQLKLLCLPYAGSSSAIFRDWVPALAPAISVVPIELPGRGARRSQPCFTTVEQAVNSLVKEVSPHFNGPYALFGHSMGALIAYELCRSIAKLGISPLPTRLFVSGCPAPHTRITTREKSALPDNEFIEELRQLKGTPSEILDDPQLMKILMPMLRSDFHLVETYKHASGPLVDCPVTVLAGSADVDMTHEAIDGWREVCARQLNTHVLPGDHFFLHSSKDLLLSKIRSDLNS